MDDSLRSMMRREARQAAIGHTIVLFGLYAAVAFLMPRFLVLFEGDLATRGSVANLAAEWALRVGHIWPLTVPSILLLGYLDYRTLLALRFGGKHILATLWGLTLVGSMIAGFLWFCWALSVWPIIVWRRLNEKVTGPQWTSSLTLKALAVFAGTFVGLSALALLVEIRDRSPRRGAPDRCGRGAAESDSRSED